MWKELNLFLGASITRRVDHETDLSNNRLLIPSNSCVVCGCVSFVIKSHAHLSFGVWVILASFED